MIPDYRLTSFMEDSNAIEGEIQHPYASDHVCMHGRLNEFDLRGARQWMDNPNPTEKDLLELHGILFQGRDLLSIGEYRRCNVTVGRHKPCDWRDVQEEMDVFWKKWPELDSWQAHNTFEHIHPFEDGNGRTGRLLWLYKACQEGYGFDLSFLHQYYYQTLNHVRN